MTMSKQRYTLELTHAPNGGWIVTKGGEQYLSSQVVAAYSNKSHMLTGLSDMIDEMEEQDDNR